MERGTVAEARDADVEASGVVAAVRDSAAEEHGIADAGHNDVGAAADGTELVVDGSRWNSHCGTFVHAGDPSDCR